MPALLIVVIVLAAALGAAWVYAWKFFFWTLRHPLVGLVLAGGAWLLMRASAHAATADEAADAAVGVLFLIVMACGITALVLAVLGPIWLESKNKFRQKILTSEKQAKSDFPPAKYRPEK